MSRWGRMHSGVDAQLEYLLLGPLKDNEVLWLADQSQEVQRRYLLTIYGPVVVDYARRCYKDIVTRICPEDQDD